MNPATILLELAIRGVRLEVNSEARTLDLLGRIRTLDPELLALAREAKPELLEFLADPRRRRELAHAVWKLAVDQVAEQWDRAFAGAPAAPWLPPDRDEGLQLSVGAALRSGDPLAVAVEAAQWRGEWLALLHDRQPTGGSR